MNRNIMSAWVRETGRVSRTEFTKTEAREGARKGLELTWRWELGWGEGTGRAEWGEVVCFGLESGQALLPLPSLTQTVLNWGQHTK